MARRGAAEQDARGPVATIEAVEIAIADLAGRLSQVDQQLRRAYLPSRRTVEALVTDLELRYHAIWEHGGLSPVRPGPLGARPDIRLGASSDDLLRLADGTLALPTAYATGRVLVQAPMRDLLRLTTLW
jgi:hypothetical protein